MQIENYRGNGILLQNKLICLNERVSLRIVEGSNDEYFDIQKVRNSELEDRM